MNKEIAEAFNGLQKELIGLYSKLINSDFESNQEVFDAALDVYGRMGELIESIEDADSNLDPENTKLPNIDGLFEAPINEYVSAAINFVTSQGDKDAHKKLIQAAENLEAHQKSYEVEDDPETSEDECEEACCPMCCVCSYDDMKLADYIDETEDEYAALVMGNMAMIEQELKGKTEFSAADLYLIRYYLKHQSFNDELTVEGLSDRGLELAWKRIQYIKNNR